jgi:hypothetical protein
MIIKSKEPHVSWKKNEEEKNEKQFLQKLKSIFTHGLEQKYHEIIIMTKVSALNC